MAIWFVSASVLRDWLVSVNSPQTLTLDKVASVYDLPYFLNWVNNCGLETVWGVFVSFRGEKTVPGEARGTRWKVTKGFRDELELTTVVIGISGELRECARVVGRSEYLWILVKSTFPQRAATLSSALCFNEQRHSTGCKSCVIKQWQHNENN